MTSQRSEAQGEGRVPGKPRSNETVLLVDDVPEVRAYLCFVLKREGYLVLEAANTTKALQVCEEYTGPIHLLLTDAIVAPLTGQKLAEKVVTLRPTIRVLCISGYTHEGLLSEGLLHPATDFLQKPMRPEALLGKVREVLDRLR
jgi:two-component system, cell cycle sensor histidine kinase and response regulator CckA